MMVMQTVAGQTSTMIRISRFKANKLNAVNSDTTSSRRSLMNPGGFQEGRGGLQRYVHAVRRQVSRDSSGHYAAGMTPHGAPSTHTHDAHNRMTGAPIWVAGKGWMCQVIMSSDNLPCRR